MDHQNHITHLNVQTNCNLSFSLIKIDDLIKFSLEKKMKYLSISDYKPYDFLKFYWSCKQNKIKPIFGIKKKIFVDDYWIIINLFPKKYRDFRILNEFFYSHNEINFLSLSKIMKNCLLVLESNSEEEIELLNTLRQKLDPEHIFDSEIYLGINFFPKSFENLVEKDFCGSLIPFFSVKCFERGDQKYLDLFKKTNLSSCFLEDEISSFSISYLRKNELFNEIKYNLRKKSTKKHEDKFYKDLFERVDSFNKKINLSIKSFTPKEKSADFFKLEKKCKDNFKLLQIDSIGEKKYQIVLNQELKVIKKFGYSHYFLVLSDIVKKLFDKNVEIGPGRGSSSSSLVSYLLNITQIDPIKNNLFFWRFLNEKRQDYPDVDIDVENQEETLNEIKKEYGKNFVSKIVTKKKIGWNNALRAGLQIFNIENQELLFFEENLERFSKDNLKSFRVRYLKEKYNKMFNFINNIFHLNISVSTHASGLIISEKNLTKIIPIKEENGFLICLYPNENLKTLGLKKHDFLGLTESLGFVKYLKKLKSKVISYRELNLNDTKTWNIFRKCLLIGVFQLDTPFFKEILKKFEPRNFQDLILMTSLSRPGANRNLEDICRKRSLNSALKKNYFNFKDLNLVLSSTYGNIIFEEQVTQVLSLCLSLDIFESELLRKKMKIIFNNKEELKKFEAFFFENSSNNLNESDKVLVWDKLLRSIPYMFNKAHATSYSYLTYYTAYLKANYFLESLIFFLNKNISNKEKTYYLIEEAITMGIDIFKPEINSSNIEWEFDDKRKSLIMGFSHLKNYDYLFFNEVVKERNENGQFHNWKNFIERIDKKIESRDFINWIKVGLFRSFNYNSEWLVLNFLFLIRYIRIKKIMKFSNEKNLPFLREPSSFDFKTNLKFSSFQMNKNEWETLTFYISYFSRWRNFNKNKDKRFKIEKFLLWSQKLHEDNKEQKIKIYSVVRFIKQKKSGVFLELQDFNSVIEVFISAALYKKYSDKLFIHNELIFNISFNRKSKICYLPKVESIENDNF